jgi:hypothetical protein
MPKINLDDALRDQLARNGGPIELCDRDGRTVAYALAPEEYKRLLYAWVKTQFSDEQAERAWNDYLQNGGVSSGEAWKRVLARASPTEGAA